MKIKSRFSLMTAMIMLVLIFSAVVTVPVYADDGAPPPEEIPVVEAPPVEESTPVVESTPVEETVAEILEQLPEGVDVVVLDQAGEALPLASEEAAQTITHGDPQWCPVGTAPGAATCSPAFTSFLDDETVADTGLIAWLNTAGNAATISKAGVIWIAWDYNPLDTIGPDGGENGTVVIDGSLVAGTMENFALTIQGGWSGVLNTTTLHTADPYSTFTNPFVITNWNGAITLNNIIVDVIDPVDASIGNALSVGTTGNIVLNNVSVQNNDNSGGWLDGAYLNNTSSSTGAGVTINNSSFNNNQGYGLEVNSDGIVTVKNIVANDNGSDGVVIDNTSASIDKAVTFTGIQQFNNNGGSGLTIYSDGAITLANVVANGNTDDGVHLENTTSLGKLGVTIKGSNSFLNNNGDGLSIKSYGAILLNNINASGNDDNGAYLDNCDVGIDCLVPLAKTVTLTGTNIFNDNTDYGLEVYSFGSIVVSNVTASNNSTGVYLDNHQSSAVTFKDSIGNVTINGYGVFNDNTGSYGLYASSYGSFTAANLTANDNNDQGAYIHFHKTGIITGVNTFNGNNGYAGLNLYADGGKVTMSNVTANDNGVYGAYFDVYGNSMASVTLTGVNVFNDNVYIGLYIDAKGFITVSNVTANGNGDSGADLSNDASASFPVGVTLSGTNNFNGNGNTGLDIDTYGAILINNLTANDNTGGGDGAYLNNFNGDNKTVTPVTITGFVHTNNNEGTGLYIETWGVVTLANITANNNEYGGVYIDNAMNTLVQSGVTISGVNIFSHNDMDGSYGNANGLYIASYGAVLLSNVTADGNSYYGVYINNAYGVLAMPVTISGYLHASNNLQSGLGIYSAGAVLLTNIIANENGDNGVDIENDHDEAKPFNVTITGVNIFNDNSNDGLNIFSYGSILLSNLTANENGSDGIDLDNDNDNTPSPITITGAINASGNISDAGIEIDSNGAVKLGNITANNNGGEGADIENDDDPAKQMSITLTGANTFSGNGSDGLFINSYGAILLNNINAYGNSGNGADLDNTYSFAPKDITLTGVNLFMNNGGDGLYFETHGMATLSRVTASGNNDGFDDEFLGDNDNLYYSNGITGYAKKSITLTCASVSNNEGFGFNLTSTTSTVKINGLFTYNNLQGYTGDYGFPSSENISSPAATIVMPCALP